MRRFLPLCGVAAGLAIVAVGSLMALLAALSVQWPPTGKNITGVPVFAVIALMGAGVTHLSSREFFPSLLPALRNVLRTFSARLPLAYPEGLAFWTFVTLAGLILLPAIPHLLVVLFGFIVYLMASTVMLAIAPRWWYRLFFTLIASIVLVAGLVTLSETLEPRSIGEGGLAILRPMMYSWECFRASSCCGCCSAPCGPGRSKIAADSRRCIRPQRNADERGGWPQMERRQSQMKNLSSSSESAGKLTRPRCPARPRSYFLRYSAFICGLNFRRSSAAPAGE